MRHEVPKSGWGRSLLLLSCQLNARGAASPGQGWLGRCPSPRCCGLYANAPCAQALVTVVCGWGRESREGQIGPGLQHQGVGKLAAENPPGEEVGGRTSSEHESMLCCLTRLYLRNTNLKKKLFRISRHGGRTLNSKFRSCVTALFAHLDGNLALSSCPSCVLVLTSLNE